MPRTLLPLAMATFAVGTDGFVIAGLLPAIAGDLGVGTATAGQLVTVFAITFAVAAPVLGWLTSGLDRRTALLAALAVFTVGNVVTALGHDFTQVLTARVLTAAGAGTITSSAASTAAALSPVARRGRSLAVVMGGLTLSTAVGLPLGTLIGRDDWRLTLWAVAAVGAIAALGVALDLPRVVLPTTSLGTRLAPLRERWILLMLSVTALSMAGPYFLYTYISAAATGATGGSATTLTVVLTLWGLGVLGGTLLAGRLADRFDPAFVVAGALAALTLTLVLGPVALSALPTTLVWAMVWGLAVGLPTVPQQQRLIGFAPASSPVLLGLNSSAIYLGIAAGGGLGGLTQHWLVPRVLGLPAAALTLIALPLALRPHRPPVHAKTLEENGFRPAPVEEP